MAGEQLFTHQLLKALHLLTDSRLGTTHRSRGCCKGIQISDRNKRSQQIEIEIQYRTICVNHISSLTGCVC
jgi:hypothetical protein